MLPRIFKFEIVPTPSWLRRVLLKSDLLSLSNTKEVSAQRKHKKLSQNTDRPNQRVALWSKVPVSAKNSQWTQKSKRKLRLSDIREEQAKMIYEGAAWQTELLTDAKKRLNVDSAGPWELKCLCTSQSSEGQFYAWNRRRQAAKIRGIGKCKSDRRWPRLIVPQRRSLCFYLRWWR